MLASEKNWVIAFVLVSIVLLGGCGKNDPFVPINQAPAPVGNPYYNPNGYNPTNYPNYYPYQGNQQQPYYPNPNQYAPGYQPGGGYPSPYFSPQVPNGYSSQYTPFLPIDNYMRRTPQLQNYWSQFWGGWQSHCQRTGRNPYDFSYFWTQYCPQQWQGTQYWDLYQSFNSQFYSWVQPGISIQVGWGGAGNFWAHYAGHPYVAMDDYGYCGGRCAY